MTATGKILAFASPLRHNVGGSTRVGRTRLDALRQGVAPRLGRSGLVAAGVALAAALLPGSLGAGTPAAAASVASLQATAAHIAAEVNASDARLQILSEEYDQAALRVTSLGRQIRADRALLGRAESSVHLDAASLRHDAVVAYVNAGSSSELSVVMSADASSLPIQQAYLQAASGSLSTAMTSLQDSRHRLTVREATLGQAQSAAARSEQTLASSKKAAATVLAGLGALEEGVRGRLAVAVSQQQQLQQQQAAARSAALRAAAPTVAQAVSQPAPPSPNLVPATSSSAGSSAGEAAVHAAESQLGVPYVWAGATPGQGFDCSGLTMWAWGQAGVNLPHSAQDQYDSIEHVSLSALQPGDLVFYASGGYIYHVIMYIGGGQAVQAENTGTSIQITPVWPGAYGAGRP